MRTRYLYVIETSIDNELHYYSHWERLHESSSVYGPVWNQYMGYSFVFGYKNEADRMVERIMSYDNRTVVKVLPITREILEKAMEIVDKFNNE